MIRYDYLRPLSLQEAWRLLAETPGSRFIAGGTDLVVQIRKRQLGSPEALISLRSIPDLSGIGVDGEFRIGSLVTIRDLTDHPEVREAFPELIEVGRLFGSRQIRNVATVGGNLCNASPAADLAPPLLVRGARVEARTAEGSREIPLDELFLGPGKTALRPGEILSAVIVPRPQGRARALFLRKGRVRMDLAIASVSVLLEVRKGICHDIRIAAGSVAPVPLRLRATEALVQGKPLTDDLLRRASEEAAAAVSPITDIRSSAEYRRHLVGVFVRRALKRLAAGDRDAP